mmetsp:Transcript_3683/g.9268  ORF Transcript_3683/g.9268 Transcript_3683/m.9268 type:complete len:263 (+) Transcript_3683:1445-2233(+)
MVMSSRSSWQANPMFSAVSCLSPVSTQILIPALASVAMASGTPTCSLSSIAVAPTMIMSFSISSAAASSAPSLSSSAVVAALCSAFHSDHCSSVSSLLASTRVRSPSVAYVLSVVSICCCIGCPSRRRSHMTLSAPFTYRMILPSGVLHTELMRLRELLNLLMLSTSYRSSFPSALIVVEVLVLPQKNHPMHLAKSVRAPSSGDSAWYTILCGSARSPSGTTVWLTARIRRKSVMCSLSGWPSCTRCSKRVSLKWIAGSRWY